MQLLVAVFTVIVLANWISFVASIVLLAANFSVERAAGFVVYAVISVALFALMMRALDLTASS